jgi:hypothetical protein
MADIQDAHPEPASEGGVMRVQRLRLSLLLAGSAIVSVTVLAIRPVQAQPNGGDCQTLVTCSYSRGGVYRGCLSSYSCRVCKLVPAACSIGPGSRVCYRMVCTWG